MVSKIYALLRSYLDFWDTLDCFPFLCPNCALGALIVDVCMLLVLILQDYLDGLNLNTCMYLGVLTC